MLKFKYAMSILIFFMLGGICPTLAIDHPPACPLCFTHSEKWLPGDTAEQRWAALFKHAPQLLGMKESTVLSILGKTSYLQRKISYSQDLPATNSNFLRYLIEVSPLNDNGSYSETVLDIEILDESVCSYSVTRLNYIIFGAHWELYHTVEEHLKKYGSPK